MLDVSYINRVGAVATVVSGVRPARREGVTGPRVSGAA